MVSDGYAEKRLLVDDMWFWVLLVIGFLIWVVMRFFGTKEYEYRWKGKKLSNENELYCGFFGKRVIKSIKDGVVILGCECDPAVIENGSFDTTKWDYTCNKGYKKCFDGKKRKYRPEPGLRGDISLRELYAKKMDGESFCMVK